MNYGFNGIKYYREEPEIKNQREQVDFYVKNNTRIEKFHKKLPYWRNQTRPLMGKKYTDPLFPPNENTLLSKDNRGQYIDKIDGPEFSKQINLNEISWLRASEIFKNQEYLIFEDKIEMSDSNQGILGDCYFFAACSAITEYPNLVYQIFKTKDVNEEGYFEVIFFIDGKFQIVIIDDYFPVYKKTKQLCFSKPHSNELWVCILEKAWAKINGGYTNIIGGFSSQVLEAFTGFPSQTYTHFEIDREILWDTMVKANKSDFILTCSTKENVKSKGLLEYHSYSIIDLYEIRSKNKKVKLVELRNTWGQKEWEGDWSDKSSLWGPEEKAQVNWEEKDNGIFFMSFDDYYNNYLITEICYILYNSYSKSYSIEGDDINEGNVFNIYLDSDGYLLINLIRKNWRFNRELHGSIIPSYLSIAKYNPYNRNQDNFFSEYDAKYDSFENSTLKKYLKRGFYIVYTYHDLMHSTVKNEDYYMVKFDSSIMFRHKLMPIDSKKDGFPLLKRIIVQGVLDGKGDFIPGQEEVYSSYECQFKNDGLGHLIVYNPCEDWVRYQINISEFKNKFMLSPYNSKTNFDWYIPPGEFNSILSMCINSKQEASFYPKVSPGFLDYEPEEYTEEKRFNSKMYASNNVIKYNVNLYSDYDYISLSLKEAKCELVFDKIDLSESSKRALEKEFPEIMEIIDTLPFPHNDRELNWLKIPLDKVIYVGQVNNLNIPEGRGALLYKDIPVIYIGTFKDSKLNGRGLIYQNNLKDKIYEGYFVDDKKDGRGIYYCSNGDRYEGNFVDDKIQGRGVYYFANGDVYKGNFVNGMFQGKGVYYYSNGNIYEGNYKENKKSGFGSFTFKNQGKWEGNFTDDVMDGRGTFTGKDGKKSTIKYNKGKQVN